MTRSYREGTVAWLDRNDDTDWLFARLEAAGRDYANAMGLDVNGISEPLRVVQYRPGDSFDGTSTLDDGDSRGRKITVTVQLQRLCLLGGDIDSAGCMLRSIIVRSEPPLPFRHCWGTALVRYAPASATHWSPA